MFAVPPCGAALLALTEAASVNSKSARKRARERERVGERMSLTKRLSCLQFSLFSRVSYLFFFYDINKMSLKKFWLRIYVIHLHTCACMCVYVVCYVCYTHVSNSIDSIDRQKTEKEREGELKREVTLDVGHSRVCRNFYNVEYLFYYFYIIFLFYL